MKAVLLVFVALLATANCFRGSSVLLQAGSGPDLPEGNLLLEKYSQGRAKHRGFLQRALEAAGQQLPGVRKKEGVEELTASIQPRRSVDAKPSIAQQSSGLPGEECITYKERYNHLYSRSLHHSASANSMNPESKFVVLMKMHMAWFDKMPQDLLLALRAAAMETTEAGYHFYILEQVPTDMEASLTREQMLALLPLDLRQFTIIHDEDDDLNAYPMVKAIEGDWGPGPKAAYAGISGFMQKYAYDYCFIAEYDVRWTGRSWGHLFNAALSLAAQATDEEIEQDPLQLRRVRLDRAASRQLPQSYKGLPDLLTFGHGGISKTEHWRLASHNINNVALYEMAAVVYGGSRRFWDAVHAWSLRGQGAHIEAFLPTVAMAEGMRAAAIDLPPHEEYEQYHHCCTDDAAKLYGSWFNNSAECMPGYLVHPVRTLEPFWPRAQITGSLG